MIGIENTDSLPWARGNPQPLCGKRGSRGWALATSASTICSSFGVNLFLEFKIFILNYIKICFLKT